VSSAFWDSSVLIPLCIVQPTSGGARQLAAAYPQIVWWGSRVEVRSAIARLYRSNSLDTGGRIIAVDTLGLLIKTWREIAPDHELRELAAGLPDQYPLRAADSMQLAAALIWCSRKPAGRVFVCSDQRLCEAAELAGFTVVRPA
jgi:uncharacterized protein